MAVDERQMSVIPIPADFPVEWESPTEHRLFFRRAADHFPTPIKPLDFAYYKEVLEFGVGETSDHYDGPITGWHLRRLNGWFYQSMVPYTGADAEQRAARCVDKIGADMARLRERWDEQILPEIMEHLAWWEAFDLEAASDEELLAHFDESWERGKRLWELHFLAIVPAYIGLSEFEEMYRNLFGSASQLEAFKLLGGIPNKTVELSAGLWGLSRSALASPDVKTTLESVPADEAVEALRNGDAGQAWLEELDAFLAAYGGRSDTWSLSQPSWIEDPSMTMKNVADLMARADHEVAGTLSSDAADEAERLLEDVRERLAGYPRAAVAQFEQLLEAARVATVIQDDHNFYIDFESSYRVRCVVLEVGRRLADAGAVEERDDVFYLYAQELREALERLPDSDVRALVTERKEELDHAARLKPPRMLGAPPVGLPTDNPVFRFMSKFYGIAPAPSGQKGVLQGLPGSPGRARGPARVLHSIDDMDKLQAGDVLIAQTTAPPWTPLFATAVAVVTDSGGVLSHCAVVAREYGIPAVVGTATATSSITDGQIVEVDGEAGVVRIAEQEDQPAAAAQSGPESATNGAGSPAPAPAPDRIAIGGGAGRVPLDDPPSFFEELLSRNRDIVTESEQGVLNGLTVLVAGTGSVGGSVVEPLVRAGVGGLVLADPDSYELNNVNRQACTLADLGRKKVDVLEERARAINPFVRVTKLPNGLTEANTQDAVAGCDLVFDGVDPSPGPLKMKFLVHRCAARRRVPVIAGADLGGQPTLYVFDYRRDPRPFYGKANVAAFREGRLFEALIPWMKLRNVPSDFLPIILDRATTPPPSGGERRMMEQLAWPQIAYTTAALGALTTRTIIDVAQGREVPHVIKPDLHKLTRRRREKLARGLRRPVVLASTVRTLRKAAAQAETLKPVVDMLKGGAPDPLRGVPDHVLATLDAMRRAPSAHNAQPWRLEVLPDHRVVVGFDPMRHLEVADSRGRYLCHSLGCAIEAASTVAHVQVDPPQDGGGFGPGWNAGTLSIEGIRVETYMEAAGAIARRATNRGPYATVPAEESVVERMRQTAAAYGADLVALQDPTSIGRYAELAGEAAGARMAQRGYVDELLEWIRFSRRELDWDEDGFDAAALGLDGSAIQLLRALKRSPSLRAAAMRIGLPAAMQRQVAQVTRQSGSLILLTSPNDSPRQWVDAGRALMAVWLQAAMRGISMHPMTWPIDLDEFRPEALELFGADRAVPAPVVLRAGLPLGPAAPSSRLPLERVASVRHEIGARA
jgi:molybdopterin/thiamine biosynthesis adenylyltransferase/phosphohistidine swiveling domain-containing protein/nitroreductase